MRSANSLRLSLLACAMTTAVCGIASAQTRWQPTPPQTEGPYYPVARPADTDTDLTRVGNGPPAQGEALLLNGLVRDCEGSLSPRTRVEIWQTDHQGIYLHPDDPRTAQRDTRFQFYGEALTDAQGAFSFKTILPGPYTGRPRHIHAKFTPPGGRTLTTQFYLKGDTDLARDFVVRRLGAGLAQVLLDPQPVAGGVRQASIEVITGRGCGNRD